MIILAYLFTLFFLTRVLARTAIATCLIDEAGGFNLRLRENALLFATVEGVYLGVDGYGSDAATKDRRDRFRHRFFVNGAEVRYTIDHGSDDAYDMENLLHQGDIYELRLDGNTLVAAHLRDRDIGRVVTGEISDSAAATITVKRQVLTLAPSCKTWRITTAAGGATVKATVANVGDDVVVTVDGEGRAENIYLGTAYTPYTPPQSGTPGVKTVKNFLATALAPVGTTLYVYGGGWNWQDDGSSLMARTIGVAPQWQKFFQQQTADYNYKNENAAQSYYPFKNWNAYYYAGLDCSGYVGWSLYNTFNESDGNDGFVVSSSKMAKSLADRGWGSTATTANAADLKPGDIFSMPDHVWICLGRCDDDSLVILHSAPTPGRTGQKGGGPQLGAIGDSPSCEAYRLADHYLKTFYPDWYSRYDTTLQSPAIYLKVGTATGRFSWHCDGKDGGLTDPDGYRDKTAAQILADLLP